MSKYAVGMIYLKDNPVSEAYRDIVKQSWLNAGYKIWYHEGITPETFDKAVKPLTFGKKERGRNKGGDLSPTEKAIWYSHMMMWDIAARKSNPLIVIEHDVMLLKHIDESLQNHSIVNLSHCGLLSKHPDKGYRVSAGGAYLLTPEMGKKLIDNVPKVITYNSDGYIHNYITRYGAFRHEHSTQLYLPDLGSTIDHG
tara:strand:+ start:6292 stop:6882 length:591 start_codon:yes stop_codon:yes gene_type:complete